MCLLMSFMPILGLQSLTKLNSQPLVRLFFVRCPVGSINYA